MATRYTRVASNGAVLRINPNTGKPFTSIAQMAAYEHGARNRAALALAAHHLTKGKAKGK